MILQLVPIVTERERVTLINDQPNNQCVQRTGICKECLNDVPINLDTQVDGGGVWECPHCDYPSNIYDFLEVFDKTVTLDMTKRRGS